MATKKRPTKITLRTYQVGFGDCFLLKFHYPSGDKHVLIDFGSMAGPTRGVKKPMPLVAADIAKWTKGKLDAVIATHRHADHISGFARNAKQTGTGDVIRALQPTLVVQPWTEDPKAKTTATSPTATLQGAKGFVAALDDMHAVSAGVIAEAGRLTPFIGKRLGAELAFHGEDNLKNKNAVENLMTMSKRREYLYAGTKTTLEKILPGVKVHVLGPPTVNQTDSIKTQREEHQDEFWHLHGLTGARLTSTNRPLFPNAPQQSGGRVAANARWLLQRLRAVRGRELLALVRMLDDAMNNTSLILVFEVGKQKLLFPGDAQWENWEYALRDPAMEPLTTRLLKGTTLYKVGHHGSLNATPRSMWKLLDNKSTKKGAGRLKTVISTRKGKHGSPTRDTEVPRTTLLDALDLHSDLRSTESLTKQTDLFFDVEFAP